MNNATGPHKVLRPFDADGTRLVPGTIVDVTDWRNGWQLVDRGYLSAVIEAQSSKPVKKAVAKKAPAKKSARVDKTPPVED